MINIKYFPNPPPPPPPPWWRRGSRLDDQTIRVRFPAYPHLLWALWWQEGKRRLRRSRCSCRGRLGTLKTTSCPWHWVPGSRSKVGTGQLYRHCIAVISLYVTLNLNQPTNQPNAPHNNIKFRMICNSTDVNLCISKWYFPRKNNL